MRCPNRCAWLGGLLACFLSEPTIWAQSSPGSGETPCVGSEIVSVPSRPALAAATDTTQCGVLEFESGLERQWPGSGANHDDLAGGLRLGLTRNLDLHWSSAAVHLMDGDGDRTGLGDNWLGLKYRFLKQTKHHPSFGLFYEAKIPSANAGLKLGSGAVDHSLSLLASKNTGRVHFDFNVIQLLNGRPDASGFDHATGLALSPSMSLTRNLNLVVEPYGYTALNANNPAFASFMAGFTYRVQPRLFLDTGLDAGVTHFAPHKRVYAGVTYAMANVFAWARPR